MAQIKGGYSSVSVPVADLRLNGGLNSTSGPLNVANNEASDLRNIDFDKFGSVLKRNGYTALNTSGVAGTDTCYGLHWFEFDSSGTTKRHLTYIMDSNFYKMDDLDGTWDDVSGTMSISNYYFDSENFLNEMYFVNGEDLPLKWTGSGNAATMDVPTDLTKAKYVKQFNNYLFLANVTVDGTAHPSRFYWSNLKDTTTWTATDFIDVSKNDGQEITGLKVLKDRLVVFKSRSIYNVFFTGDPDVPFILPGGGKSNSPVGCVGPFSIQEVDNGLVFLSYDGIYFYDGNNAYKISDKITTTLLGLNTTKLNQARSMVQKDKNRYWLALPSSGQSDNDRVIVWDYYNNAFSVYRGMSPSAMTSVYPDGVEERVYWSDYDGFVYRGDTGSDDYPANTQTAIDARYYTNWKHYGDLCDQKGHPHIYIYYQTSNAVLTMGYSYDFEEADQYSQTFSLSAGTDVYGTGVYGTATYSGSGGDVKRRDLTGRGRVVRFKFSNAVLGETFRIDGIGTLPHLETKV